MVRRRFATPLPHSKRTALAEVVAGVEAMARAGVVHGDLSAYNILVYEGRPWFIDLSGAIRVVVMRHITATRAVEFADDLVATCTRLGEIRP